MARSVRLVVSILALIVGVYGAARAESLTAYYSSPPEESLGDTNGWVELWVTQECGPAPGIPGALVYFRSESDDIYGPFPTGAEGYSGIYIQNGVGYWDISVITCEAMEGPYVKFDIYVGDGAEVNAGRFIGCIGCPPEEYQAYNPDEPFEP